MPNGFQKMLLMLFFGAAKLTVLACTTSEVGAQARGYTFSLFKSWISHGLQRISCMAFSCFCFSVFFLLLFFFGFFYI